MIMAAIYLTLRMLWSIRLINQKIEFYKLTNQKMLRSIHSAKWTAAFKDYTKTHRLSINYLLIKYQQAKEEEECKFI